MLILTSPTIQGNMGIDIMRTKEEIIGKEVVDEFSIE
jgi:hypothetical protein